MSSRTRPGWPATRGARGTPRTRRSRRRDEDEEIPEVYRDMLAEVEARENETTSSETSRPAKRFKPAGYRAPAAEGSAQTMNREQESRDVDGHMAKKLQTVYNSPSESEESDIEWEEVDTQQATLPASASSVVDDEPLQITLGRQEDRKRRVVRRKPVTAAERKLRLDVHKTHLLCLLCHVQRRNVWCNDEEVQDYVKKMLSKHIRSQLNPPEDKPQHTRSAMFLDGLNQAGDVFAKRFRVTKPGLRRPHWAHDSDSLRRRTETIMSDAEVFLSREDFRNQAKTMQGSRDFGAQLFCALLRSVAVEARLVCSLQPLPFTGTMPLPSKPEPQHIVISSDDTGSQTDGPKPEASTAKPIKRIGRPSFKPSPAPARNSFPTRPVPTESSYPVFWVEAFNEAFQKWVVIDPMVTKTLAKPHKLEPPTTDPYNLLTYVVAFEEDASARDVTRRYTRVFSAKVRKLRVESTKNGEVWWEKVLQHFEKPFLEDRDELEVAELTAKTASEPMPRNMQDFKDHPIYALERHLRSNEVIFPKRVTGHVSVGKSGSKNQSEPVYRRSDVHTLRSANKWYRLGRDIKLGEQALKRIPARNRVVGQEDDEEHEETALYAYFQTETYKPPPIVNGRVPRNAYGNLDVYVPSMVPPGGVHITHLEAARAARILGIDYADAVTGFNFKGRHGTAVLQGIVVATEFREAVLEVLDCLEEEKQRNAAEERSAEVLRTWKNFLLKLRIAERVKGYAIEGEADDEAEASTLEKSEEPDDFGGGFLPTDAEVTEPPQPLSAQDEGMGGGFLTESEDLVSPEHQHKSSAVAEDSRLLAQGDLAGGFSPENETSRPLIPNPPQRRGTGTQYELVVVPNNAAGSSSAAQDIQQDHRHPPHVFRAVGSSIQNPISVTSSANTPASTGAAEADGPIVVDSSVNNDSAAASVEILSRAPSQVLSRTQSIEPVPELSYPEDGDESEVDKGSLLSEDPDDEDAVPEWLMSD